MKDSLTRLTYKPDHAADLDTGAVVDHLDDPALCGGQDVGAIVVPAFEILPGIGQASLLVELDEVDGEPLGRPKASI